jgi:1-acyl-sn-glycerol-3-phosphate acyltransferase
LRREETKQLFLNGRLSVAKRPAWMQILRLGAGSTLRSIGKAVTASFSRALEILYGLYFAGVFLLALVLTCPRISMIQDRGAAGRFTCSVLKILFAVVRCPVQVLGKEFVDTPGPRIFAANHASYFDVLPLMLGLGVRYRFVAKMEISKIPFVGTFLKQMGHLSFDRTDPTARLQQAEEIEQLLRSGESIFIFPEGTFTAEEGIRPFQLGAFKAAVAAGVPIIPVSLSGTRKLLRDRTYLPRRSSVTITLSPPIYPRNETPLTDGRESSDWHQLIHLRDETRTAIARHVPEPLL